MLVKYNPKGEHSEFLTKYKSYEVVQHGYKIIVVECDDGIRRTFPMDMGLFTIIPEVFAVK